MTTPTLNVNLRRCTCGHHVGHGDHCWGKPILLPCPIQRMVEMMVRLGECDCALSLTPQTAPEWHHSSRCPARPIHVTCTIGGDGTWAGSEVKFAEMPDGGRALDAAFLACRDLWEIVKALLTESVVVTVGAWLPAAEQTRLIKQRDAVFEALADLVRLDTQRDAALARAAMALGSGVFVHSCPRAEEVLGQYVSHLIAKVSEL